MQIIDSCQTRRITGSARLVIVGFRPGQAAYVTVTLRYPSGGSSARDSNGDGKDKRAFVSVVFGVSWTRNAGTSGDEIGCRTAVRRHTINRAEWRIQTRR